MASRRPTKPVKKVRASAGPKPRTLTVAPAEPDEFSAMGGMPVVSVPGLDRSSEKRAVRDLTWSQFDGQVQALAREALAKFKPDAVVGLVHGGVFVGGAIASALKLDFFPVRITRRSRDTGSTASDDMPAELKGRRLLIVDDIASSGDSLEFALKLARSVGVKQVATLALLSRPGGYQPDFTGFTTDEFFIFPWDYAPLVGDGRFDPETKKKPVVAAKANSKAKPKAKAKPRA